MGYSLLQTDLGPIFLVAVTLVVFAIPIFILFPPIPVEQSDALRQTHSKLGLPVWRSNLRTQYRHELHQPQPGRPGIIQSLFIYPIKSCRGIEVTEARVLPNGLEHDRLFAFAQLKPARGAASDNDEDVWEFITLRSVPLMANVKVDIWLPDATKSSRQLGKLDDNGFVVVRFPCGDTGLNGLVQSLAAKMSRGLSARPEKSFMLPLDFPSKSQITARGYEYAKVKVWSDTPSALNMEREVPPELARYLGVKNRLGLFRMDPENRRLVSRSTPATGDVGYQPVIDFHDAYPVNLLGLTSVYSLESMIEKDKTLQHLDVRRFRTNIIISGTQAYDEEDWKLIQIQPKGTQGKDDEGAKFNVSCRTTRCKLPNVDPATGIRHVSEPDRALRKFRNVDETAPKLGCLGMQMCPIFPPTHQQQSMVKVCMEVNVLGKEEA